MRIEVKVLVIAIVEAAVAFACLPLLPAKVDGMDVVLGLGIYGTFFFGALAACDVLARRQVKSQHMREGTQRQNRF